MARTARRRFVSSRPRCSSGRDRGQALRRERINQETLDIAAQAEWRSSASAPPSPKYSASCARAM